MDPRPDPQLLALPAEIRLHIFEYVFSRNLAADGFKNQGVAGGICLNEDYHANEYLQPLLACRQMYADGHLLAMQRTSFVARNLFFDIPQRLSLLHDRQVASLRSIAFVADARHFRKLLDWGEHPFEVPALRLDTLTVVLHRSSFWHYLFDFTADLVKLLRRLEGVRRLVFVRNHARVKGSFKTWYNRLVGLMMKVDHYERYVRGGGDGGDSPVNQEKTWWRWSFDEVAQSFCLEAAPSKPWVDEETYLQQMLPLMEELRVSVENEEWNPDPRSRNGA